MKTLKSSFNIKGVGLMSGVEFEVDINPVKQKGIYFRCNDKFIKASTSSVVSADHCVVIANVDKGADFRVALIEHFMAAAAIAGLDGVEMAFKPLPKDFPALPAFEVPILDGSAKVWLDEFNKAGFEGEEDNYPKITDTVVFQKDRSTVLITPCDGETKITYAVNFNHPELRMRWVEMKQDVNLNEIVEARTFGYLKDLETFQKMGLSRGVTIENTVGLTEEGYTTSLRSEFEPVKHKILDITGDLYLTGLNPLKAGANIIVKEAGHKFHIEAARLLEEKLKALSRV